MPRQCGRYWLKNAGVLDLSLISSFYTRLCFSLNIEFSAARSVAFGSGGCSGGDGRRFRFLGLLHVASDEYLRSVACGIQSWAGLPDF